MRKLLIFVVVCCWCTLAVAQSAAPRIEPSQPAKNAPPIITFTLDFPAGSPPFYNIAIESTGRAEYKSTPLPKNQGDPYEVKFLASAATRTRLFNLARELHFFRGKFNYTKSKVAFTGTKTLSFTNGKDHFQTSYNWSENPKIQEITTLFENIEETMNLGRELETKYRYDKLGVDAVLNVMVDEAKENRLAELQAIQPILSRIANDPDMMHISRRQAEVLLSKIPGTAAASSNGAEQ